jgi:predicted O-linked N-acetylglucosamine transferase (SPINDLY family)
MLNWFKNKAAPAPAPATEDAAALRKQAAAFLAEGNPDSAVQAYRRALDAVPGDADTLVGLGYALLIQDRTAEAAQALEQALAADSDNADAHYMLANIAEQRGDMQAAMTHFGAALAHRPELHFARSGMARLLWRMGRRDDARQVLEQGSALAPAHADYYLELGDMHATDRRWDAAAACFQKALALDSTSVAAHARLGNALRAQGRLAQAETHYRSAAALLPGDGEIAGLLGQVLHVQGKLDEAARCYETSLAQRPDAANYKNLANVRRLQGRLDEAIACYEKALAINPADAATCRDLGTAQQRQGNMEAAIAAFRRALALQPDFADARSKLLFAMSYHPGCTPENYLAEARRYGEVLQAATPAQAALPAPSTAVPPLRVGLVSGDLRCHPVAFFLECLLEHADRSRMELFAYPTQSGEDDFSAQIRRRVVKWTPIDALDDDAAAARIAADGIHVLIDLAGHTAHHRLPVFARRPAPLQVSWLGYFASTGVTTIDCVLADDVSVSQEMRSQFTETVRYLPDTRLCFTPPDKGEGLEPAPAPLLKRGHVTFGCFQNLPKINDRVLATWARILDALPDARLVVQTSQMANPQARVRFGQHLATMGIAPQRATIRGMLPRDEYLRSYADIDIVLDTFPYPGGTTTCEALWMGAPTLTLAGKTMLSRQGASMLKCVGLNDWIADSEDDYVARAIAHARDVEGLARLRTELRARTLASPLFDGKRFADAFTDTLLAMWREKFPGVV